MKLFKKEEVYGLDICVQDVYGFKQVLDDFGFKYEDLGPWNEVRTLKIKAPKRALVRLVNLFNWTGGVVGPYKRS